MIIPAAQPYNVRPRMAVLYLYRLVVVALVVALSPLGLHSRIYLVDYFQMTSVWSKIIVVSSLLKHHAAL